MPFQTNNTASLEEKQLNGVNNIPNDQQQQLLQVATTNGTKKELLEPETPQATATVVVPPDGGWGWVVVAASFFNNTIVDGTVMSAGMFAPAIAKEFNASMTEVSSMPPFM